MMPFDDGFTWLVLLITFFGLGAFLMVVSYRLQVKIRKLDREYLDRKVVSEQAFADGLFAHARAVEQLAASIEAHGKRNDV